MFSEEDFKLADALLYGLIRVAKNGYYNVEYLSSRSKPTEKEARAALARILRSRDVPPAFLTALARLFDPSIESWLGRRSERTLVFKNVNRGHPRWSRNFQIAGHIDQLRKDGLSYRRAIKAVADQIGKDERHIRRIYKKFQLRALSTGGVRSTN